MRKDFLIGLGLLVVLFVASCVPQSGTDPQSGTEGLPGSEGALAGQAISLGCRTTTVRSCTAGRDPNSLIVTPLRGAPGIYFDKCSREVANDYSCASTTQLSLCRTQCESTEDCVVGQCISRCGNRVVDVGENCATCAADVVCATGQSCQSGVCVAPPACGNRVVDVGENCATCAADVVCAAGQSCQSGVCVAPPAVEVCNGIDDNTNGQVDEGCDDDNDGMCDSNMTRAEPYSCGSDWPSIQSTEGNCCPWSGGDCNDNDINIHPVDRNSDTNRRSGENYNSFCNNRVDDDCDGIVDDGCETVCDGIDTNGNTLIDDGCDQDGDSYCASRPGFTILPGAICSNGGGDCNDNNPNVWPGHVETCGEGIDNNCDGVSLSCGNRGCNAANTTCCQIGNTTYSCEENILVNTTVTDCGGTPVRQTLNCTTLTSYYSGRPLTCGIFSTSGQTTCVDTCTPGAVEVRCYYGQPTWLYSCNANGQGWTNTGGATSCPSGQTCQQSGRCS